VARGRNFENLGAKNFEFRYFGAVSFWMKYFFGGM
jgi:hypothetical protein